VDQILAAMETGQGRQSDLAVLADMPGRMGPGKTFCGLAPGAMASLETGLKMFAQDFTRHVQERVCAWA
jgi:NADH-quinone oxidoreductase subunit F